MSRIRAHHSNTVSLFPFLAVLVCAMGALILLLLVTTRRIRSEALARVQDRSTMAAPIGHAHAGPRENLRNDVATQSNDANAELRAAIRRLQQQRDAGETLRMQEEKQRAAAQQTLEQTKAQLAELRRQVEAANSEQAEYALLQQTLADRLASLAKDNAAAKRRFKEIQQDNASAESKFVVVPFDGGRGTTRRPILIECSDRGLRFLPEDVLLTMDDLLESTATHNPLLSGTRALVDHWSGDRDTAEQPYVLLIVRPSGVLAYDVARFLLQRLNQPFGYELLLEDWELDLPEKDPQAVAALAAAVKQSVAQAEPGLLGGGSPARRGQLGGQRHGFYEENLEDILKRTYNDPLVAGKTGGEGSGYAATPSAGHGAPQRAAQQFPRAGESPPSPSEHPGGARDGAAEESPSRPESSEGAREATTKESPFPSGTAGERASQEQAAESQNRRPSFPEDLAPSRPDVQSFQNRRNPTGRRSGIGFERDVTVRIDADRLVVGRRQTIHLGRGETRDDLVQDVLRAISAETQAWGPPPDKFYWVPTVRFVIAPGGNQHYERLRYPLEKFGLSTRAEFVLEASNAADDVRR